MMYYIYQNDETEGPYTIGQLRSMWNSGTITGNTLYCEKGFKDWLPLETIIDRLEPSEDVPQHNLASIQQRVLLVKATKSTGVYIILGLLLGLAGIHNFYAGHNKAGAWQLAIIILLGWCGIGFIINLIWVLIDICTVRKDGDGNPMT